MLASRARPFVASLVVGLVCTGCLLDGGPVLGGAGGEGAQPLGGSTPSAGGAGGSTATTAPTGPCTDPLCDDGDPCTIDTCPTGTCEHTPASDGTAIEDLDLHDCLEPVCVGGVPVQEVDTSQSPDPDPLDCLLTTCLEAGGTRDVFEEDGALCGEQPSDKCQRRACDRGACVIEELADGTVIDPGDTNLPEGGADCRDLVCLSGVPKLVPNILNCKDLGPTNCWAPACTPAGQCKGNAGDAILAPEGFPCDTDGNGSLDGQCDGIGGDGNHCKKP